MLKAWVRNWTEQRQVSFIDGMASNLISTWIVAAFLTFVAAIGGYANLAQAATVALVAVLGIAFAAAQVLMWWIHRNLRPAAPTVSDGPVTVAQVMWALTAPRFTAFFVPLGLFLLAYLLWDEWFGDEAVTDPAAPGTSRSIAVVESGDIAWGDVPTWMNMIVTGVAVAAAIYAGRAASKMLRVERDRDQAARESDKVQQAARVAAWAEPDPAFIGADLTIPRAFARVKALAVNGSDQPVYNVVIAWYRGDDVLKTDGADLIPPGDERTWSLPEMDFDSVIDGDASELLSTGTTPMELSRLAAERLRVEITFTDSQNRTWRRSPAGVLAELHP